MNDELTTRLSRQLHDQVDGWHDAPLTLEGVQGRARTIRRRRQAMTSGVVAAAVLAVAIPAGFGLASRTDSTPDYTNPSPTRVVDDAPTPRADGTFPLAPLDAPEGPAPGTGVIRLADSTLVTAGGEQQLPEGTVQIERFGDGWLALQAGEDVPGGTRLLRLDADRQVVEQVSAAGLVVDAAGEHAAWIEVDGGAWILAQATPDRALGSLKLEPDTQLVGHLTGGGVVFQTFDYENGGQRFGVVDADGRATPFDAGLALTATSEATSQVAAMTEYGAQTCYAVLDPTSGTRAFETCDFEPRAFSPDGDLVVGFTAGDDGLGSPQLAVLDAATGEPLVEWSNERRDRSPALVQQAVWEDDDTLLATVIEGTEQTVVRVELDGTMQRVAEPLEVNMSIAYVFPGSTWGLD